MLYSLHNFNGIYVDKYNEFIVMEIQFFRQSDTCQNPFNSMSGLVWSPAACNWKTRLTVDRVKP